MDIHVHITTARMLIVFSKKEKKKEISFGLNNMPILRTA